MKFLAKYRRRPTQACDPSERVRVSTLIGNDDDDNDDNSTNEKNGKQTTAAGQDIMSLEDSLGSSRCCSSYGMIIRASRSSVTGTGTAVSPSKSSLSSLSQPPPKDKKQPQPQAPKSQSYQPCYTSRRHRRIYSPSSDSLSFLSNLENHSWASTVTAKEDESENDDNKNCAVPSATANWYHPPSQTNKDPGEVTSIPSPPRRPRSSNSTSATATAMDLSTFLQETNLVVGITSTTEEEDDDDDGDDEETAEDLEQATSNYHSYCRPPWTSFPPQSARTQRLQDQRRQSPSPPPPPQEGYIHTTICRRLFFPKTCFTMFQHQKLAEDDFSLVAPDKEEEKKKKRKENNKPLKQPSWKEQKGRPDHPDDEYRPIPLPKWIGVVTIVSLTLFGVAALLTITVIVLEQKGTLQHEQQSQSDSTSRSQGSNPTWNLTRVSSPTATPAPVISPTLVPSNEATSSITPLPLPMPSRSPVVQEELVFGGDLDSDSITTKEGNDNSNND